MRVAAQLAARQAGRIDQAGVVEPVLHAHVAVLQQCLLDGEIGEETAAEQQATRIAQPVGDVLFQAFVGQVMPGDQVGSAGARAFAAGRILQRVLHLELLGQAQIVVAGEFGQPAAIDLHPHAVAAGDGAAHARASLGGAELALVMDAF